MSARRALLVLAPLFGALLSVEARAQDLLVRTFAQDHGLAAPPVWALAQDSTGFLWIGAEGGLFRFDGSEIRRWARDTVRDAVDGITVSPGGRVVVRERSGKLFEVEAGGARPLPLPDLPDRTPWETLAFDRHGLLWLVQAGTVAYRDERGDWRLLPDASFAGERPRRVKQHAAGGVLAVTDAAVWHVLADTAPRRLYEAPLIRDVLSPDPERVLVLALDSGRGGRMAEITPGGVREVFLPRSLPGALSFAERNGTLWIALDRFLLALRPGEPLEVIGAERGYHSGGPLLVDREGSLWLGSYVGLHQYPEPDTRTWGDRDGLPSRFARFLARTGDAIWAGTWAGNGYLHRSPNGWTVRALPWDTHSLLCSDARGTVWTIAEGSLLAIRDTVVTRVPASPATGSRSCARAPDGGIWIGTRDDLRYVQPAGTPRVRVVASPPGTRAGEERLVWLHDSRDRLWLGVGERICHAPADRVLAGDENAWRCEQVPGLGYLSGVVELPSGTLWASSGRLGILAWQRDGWQPLPMDDLPTRTVFALVPSPRGGVWIVGHGILKRVRERDGGRWEVLERLTGRHGLWASGGGHLAEDADGTLWIATSRGVTRVPPEVRFAARPIPPVVLIEARVDEQPVSLDGPLRLPHNRNRVELRFAALAYRDPSQVRHQVRLGPDEPWSESDGRPSFRWVDLRPGRYEVEYRASLDGINWSPEPIRFGFEVRPAWYLAPWFLALLGLLAVTLVWSVYRARVAYLLELERQRTRIAMDLHDEVGSGLASVGILSGVLAADGLDERERRQMATEIAAAAEDLGHALSDIVWSLDPRTATLQELATRLAEHGGRLCADDEPAFSTHFPTRWPEEPLDVSVRRNVLLVGLEALHNAVRHADARAVTLSLLPCGGGAWELSVQDDGVGFTPEVRGNGRRGHGLPGMQRRAEEIGARLEVRSRRGRGTAVVLRFGERPRQVSVPALFGERLRRLVPRRLA